MSKIQITGNVSGTGTVTIESPNTNTDSTITLPSTGGTMITTTTTGLNANNITTGILAVVNGGTGSNTLTANNVILGNGTSAVQFVAPGTASNVLTSNGTSWVSQAAGGGGKLLQVVSTTKTDTFTTTSGTYVDITGMSVSITPSNSANKILILVNLAIINSSASTRYVFKLVRNSTDIGSGTGAGARVGVMAGDQTTAATGGFLGTMGGIHLDSPATTSATTYKVQTYAIDSGTIIVNRTMNDTDGSTYFRTSSSITAMEIAA